jgi:hypothetical protein
MPMTMSCISAWSPLGRKALRCFLKASAAANCNSGWMRHCGLGLKVGILPVSQPIAERWGVLAGQCQLQGRPLKVVDGFIAATALEHDLTVVTRNARDFAGLGVTVVNPWEGI